MSTVNAEQRNIHKDNPDSDFDRVQKVALRAVLTPDQVLEIENRKKQPTSVMTQLHGNSTGFHMLDDRVDPQTKAMLDEQNKMILIAPVAGG